ncbi:MAG: hypothetical protein ABL958_15025 [Bdellovibrionia bacterium]
MKTGIVTLIVLFGMAAQAGSKKSKTIDEDVPDFEFLTQEKALDLSYGFQDEIHRVELVQAPEPNEAKLLEPFKEIDGQEIDDNFNVTAKSKRKPASLPN